MTPQGLAMAPGNVQPSNFEDTLRNEFMRGGGKVS